MILRAAAMLFFASIVSAAATDCKTISEPTARLACYDAPKAPKKPVKPKAVDPYSMAKAAMSKKLTDPESVRWGEFWDVTEKDGSALVCGAVNSKNAMGGYVGMTGFTYEWVENRAILLFSGETDPDAGIATRLYREYCLSDPRADRRIAIP